ncbi:hypothetical protein QYF61_021428 [Mycteria americana]|uniref:Glucagon / GIP / secretin / VIP family domain-containing protein n=1 Tax=Mycteria americana TaxID=33587 RepID=A0AAN7SDM8_MYCAM|nr:hypothetical protein QYF61_021428 [Mycteria americana]
MRRVSPSPPPLLPSRTCREGAPAVGSRRAGLTVQGSRGGTLPFHRLKTKVAKPRAPLPPAPGRGSPSGVPALPARRQLARHGDPAAGGVPRGRGRGRGRGRAGCSAARGEAPAPQRRAGRAGRRVTAALFPPQVAAMELRGASPLLLALALLSALCWRARALPPRGAAFPPVPRLGNRMPFDGASEPDHAHGSLKSESDILQNTLPENEKFYFDLSRIIDSSQDSPVKRHSDAVFTDNYSRFRKQMAVKKYLNSVLTGKRSQEELNPAKLRDEAELLEPSFSENYDSVDELLSHLPLKEASNMIKSEIYGD